MFGKKVMFCVVLIWCMLWCYKNVCLFYVIGIFVAWKVIDRVWYSVKLVECGILRLFVELVECGILRLFVQSV